MCHALPSSNAINHNLMFICRKGLGRIGTLGVAFSYAYLSAYLEFNATDGAVQVSQPSF